MSVATATRPAGTDRESAVGRRGFLSGLGASGLAVAIAVFGRSSPAVADIGIQCTRVQCCCICSGVRRVSYLECINCGRTYVWQCTQPDGRNACRCCECGNTSGGCSGVTKNGVRCTG